MPTPSPHAQPGGLPPGLDPDTIGQSIFGPLPVPPAPVVSGYSGIAWLADGGFGRVWSAIRDADGSPVALKIPHQTDPDAVERLETEAEALRTLEHPHIVRLLDLAATADGQPVLVMELIDGPTLTSLLPESGFDFDHALQIFLPVLDAVSHAHARGIIHRDLKPSNILLADSGTAPKVSDFGLAQSVRDQRLAFSFTRSGLLAGTVEYLAPERYEPGTPAGITADIYALGVILYEMLSGRPPRGAWRPLSQIRKLDIRLDQLVAEAIHPDPAQRLQSAAAFRKRLEEIRDTRPRYAGTPLVTRPVRAADASWTCGGLYCLAAGFCSLMRMNNTHVPGIFDLTFGHTQLLGGYWALYSLCLGMGLLWLWQTLRLWRFRHIPMREALPQPFGLRLPHSRGAAALVCGVQILCAWTPLVYMGWIYSQCWFWAGPDSVPWEKVLAITRWGSEVPLSQWTWAPEGMFSGDEFWIREMQPGLNPGEWRLLDRQSFFVVSQPLLMLLAVASIAIGLTVTVAACCLQWLPRKLRRLVALALLSGLCAFAVLESVHAEVQERRDRRAHPVWGRNNLDADQQKSLFPGLMLAFADSFGPEDLNRGRLSRALADQIRVSDLRSVSQGEFLKSLEVRRGPSTAARHPVDALRLRCDNYGTTDSVPVVVAARVFDSPPGGPVTAAFVTASLSCRRTPPEAAGTIDTWIEETTPLYTATVEQLTGSAASDWLASFLRALNTRDQSALHALLLPVMLHYDPRGASSYPHWPAEYQAAPGPREQLTAPLLASLQHWPAAAFTALSPPSVRPLPGARWELTCPLRQTGTRPDGGSARRDLEWIIELVFSGGQWQGLRLRM